MYRSALAILVLLGLLPASAGGQIPYYDGPGPTAEVSYGDNPLQVGELRMPHGEGPFPVAVTIHGGCWLDRLGEGSITPLAVALVDEGIATWNIEYRRLGHDGGGWPGTFQDVGTGIDHLRVLAGDYALDLERVVLVGHSSGAHLAVWAAGRSGLPAGSEIRGPAPLPVRAAVGIDGPLDLGAWSEAGTDAQICGEPVVSSLMGGSPAEVPDRYRQGSPAQMPSIDAAIFLNPAGLMYVPDRPDAMTARAASTGEAVTVRPVPDSNHFQLISPGEAAFTVVLETIRLAAGLSR